jgi:ABC-type Fe3+/spermidine/putrescine transport system ATPase subunit
MAYLSLTGITKAFASNVAVRDVSLALDRGEFFSLLGPSGCGKSTLLRLIAGLEKPTAGVIALDGRDITALAPQQRGIGLVFQNYALFPHMTVAENVGYGLEGRGLPRADIVAKVGTMLEALRIGHHRDTLVTTLSGGEQQRVAVGRAMVVEPSVLLFDEPLSNLDVALRQETREEIRSLQRRTGITTFYVTHDQAEAMSLSDRIAVMRTGRLEQIGSPDELYNHPASEFVAEFLGGANLLPVNGAITIPDILRSRAGEGGIVTVKPEAILISSNADVASHRAQVIEREYLGYTTTFLLKILSTTVRATAMSRDIPSDARVGQTVGITIDWSHAVAFPRR